MLNNEPISYFLFPSNLHVSKEETNILTILGSCVAVCIWDPITQIGGMNHYMLPLWNGKGLASPKYGNIAIKRLIERLENLGVKKNNMQAKVFGGGEVLETESNSFIIGKRNAMIAFEMLDEYKIPVISSNTEGKLGRKIIFNTKTGKVKLHYINQTNGKK
jgi:chemotaxis protein CheD